MLGLLFYSQKLVATLSNREPSVISLCSRLKNKDCSLVSISGAKILKEKVITEVHNTRSLHLGNEVVNMSFVSNLFLDCLFCARFDEINYANHQNAICS